MKDLSLYLWDISVALGIFGYGLIGTRLFGLLRSSLAVAGVLGVSLWIALGGILNLLHLLRPAVFFTLVASGIILLAAELLLRRNDPQPTAATTPFSLPSKLAVAAAALLILTLMVGAMRIRSWGIDDVQGYLALGVKTAQNHALQPDPFSERRVNAGVGGGIFLDALMFATGDIRAMNFIDSSFGLGLYALAVWALGRRWKVHPIGIAFTILCLPLLTLVKVNLTIVYLSAAGLLALLLLLTDLPEPTGRKHFSAGHSLALGIIISALIATRTTNVVFVLPILLAVVLLYRLFHAQSSPLLPLFYALLVALAILAPWSIASKAIVGTYLYPVLGSGTHVSAYHVIWNQAKTGSWQQIVVLAAPNLTFLLLCFAVVWNLTRHWTPVARSAVLAYIGTGILAIPISIYGVGCEDADRYTAPLAMPIYLLTLLLLFGAPTRVQASRRIAAIWRIAGTLTLLAVGLYNLLFLDVHLMCLFPTKSVLYQAFGKLPRHGYPYFFLLDAPDIQSDLAYASRIQNAIPAGATALDISFSSFHYDFHRNTIFTADIPGMASPPPGLPLNASPALQRQFLIDHGVDYIIMERDKSTDMGCDYNAGLQLGKADWPSFLNDQRRHFGFRYLLTHQTFTHGYGPWTIVEFMVSCHQEAAWGQLVDTSPQLYRDANFVVARLH